MNASFDFLNLPGIKTTSHGRNETGIVVEAESIEPKFETVCCLDQQLAPDGARANRRVINDTPHGGDRVVILMKVRRAKCKACGRKGMIETLPGVHPGRLMTQRLYEHLAHEALIRTNTRIGEAVGVTEGTVRSILKESSSTGRRQWVGIVELPTWPGSQYHNRPMRLIFIATGVPKLCCTTCTCCPSFGIIPRP